MAGLILFSTGRRLPLLNLYVGGRIWVRGLLVGLLISLPSAILTKAYAPILTVGALGGAIIGWLALKLVV